MPVPGEPAPDRVMEETRAFYLAASSASESSDHARRYPLGGHWLDNTGVLHELIQRETDPLAFLRAVHETVMYSIHAADDDVRRRMVAWYLDYLHDRGVELRALDARIEESHFVDPRKTLVHEGRRLSPDFLRTIALCHEVRTYCELPAGRFRVLELGAGYGGLARTFKLFHPETTYVIVDIPETLYVSSTFLRLSFPDARVRYVTGPLSPEASLDGYDFVFVPTVFAEELAGESFTLFCNTASLGEMKNAVIRYWMDFVQNRAAVRYFFGLNRFLNTIDLDDEAWRIDENCASVLLDAGWRILQWELDPPLARCPYLETLVSRNLEVVAERSPAEARDARRAEEASRQLVEGMARQDWFERPGVRQKRIEPGGAPRWPLPSTRADTILTPDLTMRGPLFALWNSIRLHPDPVNVAMMLTYLDGLCGKRPFEEMFYYRDLLASLTGSPPRPPASRTRRLLRRLTPPPVRRLIRRLRSRA